MSSARAFTLVGSRRLTQRSPISSTYANGHCFRATSDITKPTQPVAAISAGILDLSTGITLQKRYSTLSMDQLTKPVVVIGAGVLGLSTATVLQERYPKLPITIVAAELPSLPSTWTSQNRPSADYASAWAGAHYRPIPMSTRQLEDEAELAQVTAKQMYNIADHEPEAGVSRMPAREYLDSPPEHYLLLKTGDIYAGPHDNFRVLNPSELPLGVKFGCEYQAYTCNVHVYCSWLLNRFLERGGTIIQKRLNSVEEVLDQPDLESISIAFNCSGRNFDHDPKMQIIRGQTVLVRNQFHSTITRQKSDGTWTFLIPRPGGVGTVVGGTKEIGDMETEARPEAREKLLQEAVDAFPEFVDHVSKFEVVMDNVGRRPWRDGGLRIEAEQLPGSRMVIHAYGGGGRGYELSWGVAERAANLYDRSL